MIGHGRSRESQKERESINELFYPSDSWDFSDPGEISAKVGGAPQKGVLERGLSGRLDRNLEHEHVERQYGPVDCVSSKFSVQLEVSVE